MKYVKWLLLIAAVMTSSLATARRHGHGHGHRRHFSSAEGSLAYDEMGADNREPERERRHGRHGFHGHTDEEGNIPGYPMTGPPSAPFVAAPQGRGPHGGGGPMHGVGVGHRDNYPGAGNTYPVNNFQPPQPQHPLRTNNFPTNANPNNNGHFPGQPQGNFVPRPPLPPLSPPPRQDMYGNPVGPNINFPSRDNAPAQQQQQMGQTRPSFKPNQNININNPPAIEPVTNELPLAGERYSATTTTTRPTINPRELDLLYGSNLHYESQTEKQPESLQPEGKSLGPDGFGTRILLDSTKHCQEGYALVGENCRKKV